MQAISSDNIFPLVNLWALLASMETSFDLICPKALCSLSPTPVTQHIKFDQDSLKAGMDGWTHGDLLYYKLTLWAFGLG